MGWEIRGHRRYYTRSKKRNGRVIREYIGAGLIGELAALWDEQRRQRREEAREALQRDQETLEAAAGPHNALSRIADALMAAALVDAGYHRHDRGAWRKRRAQGT